MKSKISASLTFFSTLILLNGCGKSVQVDGSSVSTVTPPGGNGTHRSDECAPSDRLHWSFLQPQPTLNRSVDLLLVVDTSDSLTDKRARVADELSEFVQALPTQTDYRIGVLPAHGASSRYSGKLFSARNSKTVLDSRTQSFASIRSQLANTLTHLPADSDDANGEAMMFSLQKSLEPSQLAGSQSQGFFRTDAALTTIFISDENDICFPPQNHGYTAFPDFVAAPDDIEMRAYRSNCLNADGSERVTPESTLAALSAFKSDGRFAVGGVIHVDGARVPRGSTRTPSEESIGHGILEMIQFTQKATPATASGALAVDIMDSSYSAGLTQLANFSSTHLSLQTEFALTSAGAPVSVFDPASIDALVDGKTVGFSFDASQSTVQIASSDAGGAGSVVDVYACKN